eukprot:s56_g30.t1
MLEENKLVKVQPAYGPVQRMEPKEQPHDLREEEQMPGPERLKAEGKVDGSDQPPPTEFRALEKGKAVSQGAPERAKKTCAAASPEELTELDALADAVDIKSLVGVKVASAGDAPADAKSLSTRFVRTWREKVRPEGNPVWLSRSRFVA